MKKTHISRLACTLPHPKRLSSSVKAMDENEIIRASRNIPVIIGYLRRHFQGFVIRVEEQPPSRVVFSLTDLSSGERLTLGVLWPALGDRDNTPNLIEKQMSESDIAGRLKDKKNYFWSVGAPPESCGNNRT